MYQLEMIMIWLIWSVLLFNSMSPTEMMDWAFDHWHYTTVIFLNPVGTRFNVLYARSLCIAGVYETVKFPKMTRDI